MANATARVATATVPWGDDKIERPLAATAAIYYPGAMIAIDTSGNATKCDDTAGLQFDGINAETVRKQVFSGESAGDRVIKVERPWRFTMAIAAAVAGDEGRALYAVDDQTVAYSGVSNSILVGYVDQVLSATLVLVKPAYAIPIAIAQASNTLTFAGSTGANTIVMPDNLADALSVVEGANPYLTFVTTDSSEQVLLSKKTSLLDDIDLIFGTGLDALVRWSTGDASNHSLALGLGDSNQTLHITDKGAIATDWNISANTHPVVCIHSNTTPATDYLAIGAHDGTACSIDAQGAVTLTLTAAGTAARINIADGKALVVGANGVPGTYGGGNFIGLEDSGTDPSGTYTNSLAMYTPDGGDSLDFLHADGTTDSLGT